jgi:hypothetical protein
MIFKKKFISGEEVKKYLGICNADLRYLILEGLLVAHTENFESFTKEDFHEMINGPYAYLTDDWPMAGYDGLYFLLEETQQIKVAATADNIMDLSTQTLETNPSQQPLKGENVFARNGESWFTRFSGLEKHFRDRRGFHFIAHLLNSPNIDIECLDLAQIKAMPVSSSQYPFIEVGHAISQGLKITDTKPIGEHDDKKTKLKNEYYELLSELENAKKYNDPGRIERCEKEIETFKKSLRPSYEPDNLREKSRVNVTSQIKESIKWIERENPGLAKHLNEYIKTGNSCSYRPPPDSAIVWNVRFE